jgi:hypothetical protein
MHRRIACIALSEIRVEIARESKPDAKSKSRDLRRSYRSSCEPPLAVIVARPGGAVKTERDVLGNTRIDFVSREASALGVRAGQTVASARAKCAELCVRIVVEGAVRTALARIAEAALAFGPTSAFDVEQDVVWVDVGGCAHLHGGEVELARTLGARVRALGHACRVVVADGPRVAAAVARFSTPRRENDSEPIVVSEGKAAVAVRSLPITALAFDDDVSAWLADLGLSACGDLQKLPRRALGMRLGERVHDVMQFLDGRDHAPLKAWRPPEVPEERLELDWGAHSIDALAFVLKTLCDRLAARLHGRALAAARLELVLTLDRTFFEETASGFDHAPAEPGMCTSGFDHTPAEPGTCVSGFDHAPAEPGTYASGFDHTPAEPGMCTSGFDHTPAEPGMCRHRVALSIVLPSPIARAPDLLAVVRVRLERCLLAAPVLAVTLRASELACAPTRTLDLFAPEPKADCALPRLVAELVAQLGEGQVGMLTLVDTWLPADRTRLVPYTGMSLNGDHGAGGADGASEVSASERPTQDDVSSAPPRRRRPIDQHPGKTAAAKPWHTLVTSALEPSRLVNATQVSRGALVRAQHLARVEAPEWWRRRPVSRERRHRRDLFAAWIGGGLAWLELRDSSGQPLLCGWID